MVFDSWGAVMARTPVCVRMGVVYRYLPNARVLAGEVNC